MQDTINIPQQILRKCNKLKHFGTTVIKSSNTYKDIKNKATNGMLAIIQLKIVYLRSPIRKQNKLCKIIIYRSHMDVRLSL
jgi:hypothetical protein